MQDFDLGSGGSLTVSQIFANMVFEEVSIVGARCSRQRAGERAGVLGRSLGA